MRYEIKGETAIFYLDNPKRETDTTHTLSFAGSGLSALQTVPMLDALVRKYEGLSHYSQKDGIRRVMGQLLAWFRSSGNSWPTTSEQWSLAVLQFFRFCLTDTGYSNAKTSYRITNWSTRISGFLTHLKDEDIIPLDVVIPNIGIKKIRSLSKDQQLLGQSVKRIVAQSEPIQKLLVDIRFGITDADYLDLVEKECRRMVSLIRDVCLDHWNRLMRDAEIGRHLASEVSDDAIRLAITEGRYGEPLRIGAMFAPIFIRYASPNHPKGIHWALALVRYAMASGTETLCVAADTLRSSPFFGTSPLRAKDYTALDSLTSMTPEQWQHLQGQARLYRFAGLLSPLDAAAACCLLTIEHPQFTSESLQNAVLLNVRGKSRLLLTDNNERAILYVDKPRAGRLKSAALSDTAQRIILEIVRATTPVRAVLKRAGDKTWRYLFLGVATRKSARGILATVDARTSFLTGRSKTEMLSLGKLYPELGENGLSIGTFDYRRLRNTMGIIRWFETGSILEMSRKLGNTSKVTLEHYLPPALLHAWNTRIIRRFQNTLIVLAAHDEPYLLDVTDFSTTQDLQHFIAQLILDYPAQTSPLANEVQLRLGRVQQREVATTGSTPGLLNLRLSPKSLAYLYAFCDLAQRTLSEAELDKVDTLSGLAPRQFTDIATLLKHAAENKAIHSSLRGSLDVAVLTECHGRALAMQSELDARFAKISIKREWTDAA